MTTATAATHEPCVIHRGRIDRVFSGLGAIGLLGLACRVGGVPAAGLAALGGWLLGRSATRHRVGQTMVACATTSHDPVDQAGRESFPASDPPSWSPTAPGAAS